MYMSQHYKCLLRGLFQVKDEEQEAAKFDAVFPCILRILPACVFNKKDPIIVGVDIEEGIAKVRPRPALLLLPHLYQNALDCMARCQ